MVGRNAPYFKGYVAPWAPTQTLPPLPKESASLQEPQVAQSDGESHLCWPYLFPEEQDLLREYLGEALRGEEQEWLEPGEDRPVLLHDSLRGHGLSGELRAGDGGTLRFLSSEQLRHEDRHPLQTHIWAVSSSAPCPAGCGVGGEEQGKRVRAVLQEQSEQACPFAFGLGCGNPSTSRRAMDVNWGQLPNSKDQLQSQLHPCEGRVISLESQREKYVQPQRVTLQLKIQDLFLLIPTPLALTFGI